MSVDLRRWRAGAAHPLPAAPVRLLRHPIALAAVAAVAAIAIAASQIARVAEVRLSGDINAHWRGAYDILVRPRNATLDLERTDGLVEPNFVALAGHGGIRESQVNAIRAIPGVAIAAPIAWLGLMTTPTTGPTVEVTKFPAHPTLYSVTLTVSTSDGVKSHLVYEDTLQVLLGPGTAADGAPTALSNYGYALTGPLPGGGQVADLGTTHAPPQLQSPILAVDPVAEQALLGDQGAFLDPLVRLRNRDDLTAATTDPSIVLPGYNQRLDIAILQRDGGTPASRPVIPILVSRKTYAPVQVSIEVSQIGHPIARMPEGSDPAGVLGQAAKEAGPGLTTVGTSTTDASSVMRPFRLNGVGVPWPETSLSGTGIGVQVQGVSQFVAALTGRPSYRTVPAPSGATMRAFRIAPLGVVPPGGPHSDEQTPGGLQGGPEHTRTGTEQSYRPLEVVPVPLATTFTPQGHGDQPFVLAPVGEYDLGTLHLPHDPLDYVPYGAYDPPDTTLVAGPGGQPVSPAPMSPTLNPVGLLEMPPLGIVDIHAAELLRGPAPIDAVRVRVAGLADFGPEAIARVERVATAITAMGLDATVVAGSSPQAVDVYVPAYDTSASPPRDLGWVRQHWTTLGAALRVERGLTDTNVALLLLALAGTASVVIGTQILGAATRAREAAVLAALGWSRTRVVRWQAAEAAVAGVVVLAVGALAWLAGARDQLGLAVALGGAVLFVVAGSLAALVVRPLSVTGSGGDIRPPRRYVRVAVSSIATYAFRNLAARPWRSLTTVVALALAAAALAPGFALVATISAHLGPTALAGALGERLQPSQLALLTLIAVAGLAVTLLSLRLDLAARRLELRVLAAAGWRPGHIARLHTWTRVGIALPAALLSAVVGGLLAGPVTGAMAPGPWVASLAAGLALSAVAWGRLAGAGLPRA